MSETTRARARKRIARTAARLALLRSEIAHELALLGEGDDSVEASQLRAISEHVAEASAVARPVA